jgi:hypothetical protein
MSALVTKDERIIDLMKKHPTAFTVRCVHALYNARKVCQRSFLSHSADIFPSGAICGFYNHA